MLADARSAIVTWLARGLEAGVKDHALARLASSAGGLLGARALARPLDRPAGIEIVTVGGATLGGSGKTRLALACTRLLARRGVDVALVGHGYRADTDVARVVRASDSLLDVGDEALACARALARSGDDGRASVIVAPSRQAAVDHAASLARRPRVIVIDGALQIAPVRASLALLAVDARAPWGSGVVLPSGDLRAPREALLAQADLVVPVDARPSAVLFEGRVRPLESLCDVRLGLFSALARPGRLERALAEAGVVPAAVVRAPDHGPMTRALARTLAAQRVDVWAATEKCALHLAESGVADRVVILDGELELDEAVATAVFGIPNSGAPMLRVP